MLSFKFSQVYALVVDPQLPYTFNPFLVEYLDIRSFLRNIAILGCLVVASDEMRNFRCQIVAMRGSHLLRMLGQGSLNGVVSCCALYTGKHMHLVLTRVSGSMFVQHNTTPLKGADASTSGTGPRGSMEAIMIYFRDIGS